MRIHVTLSLVHPQHTGLLEIAQVHLMGSTFEVYSSDHLGLVAVNYDDYMRNEMQLGKKLHYKSLNRTQQCNFLPNYTPIHAVTYTNPMFLPKRGSTIYHHA